jgi:hypothetical protein
MLDTDTVGSSPVLDEVVATDNDLKSFIVNHVGKKLNPKDSNVTIKMVIETVADEFPEFVMTLAEENWVRGYQQALSDVDVGKELSDSENDNEE